MARCEHEGCELPRTWRPVLCFGVLRAAPRDIGVCDDHRAVLHVGDILSDRLWEQIVSDFSGAGIALPRRETVTLEWFLWADGVGNAALGYEDR